MPNLTKDTMTLADVPKHARPEEFLADADLVGLYQRELDGLKADDPKRAKVELLLARAELGALLTKRAILEVG